MSKWLKVLILSLFTAGSLWLGLYLRDSDRDYRERGEKATVASLVKLEQQTETRRSGRYRQREQTVERTLATMTYVDVNGRTITFQRFVSPEQIERLRGSRPVAVEYIPGEWNSERFEEDAGKATPWLIAFAVFFSLLIYVIRKPSAHATAMQAAHAPSTASPVFSAAAWLIRGVLLMMALGAIVGGGAGLMAGGGAGNAVLLVVGIALLGVFGLALRLRVA